MEEKIIDQLLERREKIHTKYSYVYVFKRNYKSEKRNLNYFFGFFIYLFINNKNIPLRDGKDFLTYL